MVGGTDAESDESLLARYEERLRRPAAGGNQYDFRNWCLEVPGVVDAFIYPLRRGNGFVDAVILGENGIPKCLKPYTTTRPNSSLHGQKQQV